MRHEGRRIGILVGLLWLVSACSPNTPPSGAPAVTSQPTWVAALVAQPVQIEGLPTDIPSMCNPCHPAIGTYINSMVAIGGGFLALGEDSPPSHAAAWFSADATSWARVATIPAPARSLILAAIVESPATSGPSLQAGEVLAVGGSGSAAAVWHTADGKTWSMQTLPAPARAGTVEQMTSVAQTSHGFVAAGFVESALAVKTAEFWSSPDGSRWTRTPAKLPSGPSEVTGLAAVIGSNALVAVGISGGERTGSAAVWRSTDAGANWTSVSGLSLASGRMLAVAAGRDGLCAVGETVDQTGAAAWSSTDGLTWISAAAQPGLENDGMQMVMMSIGWDGSDFFADGWRSDAGNGSAVVWQSGDCESWTHLPQDVTFSGAGMAAILVAPRLLAGGTMGWPDTHAAQVWIPPNR
jgi:hypothetical protein